MTYSVAISAYNHWCPVGTLDALITVSGKVDISTFGTDLKSFDRYILAIEKFVGVLEHWLLNVL